MFNNTVRALSQLPATDGNFISSLKSASDDEIKGALEVMRSRNGHDKSRISACERELRKRGR